MSGAVGRFIRRISVHIAGTSDLASVSRPNDAHALLSPSNRRPSRKSNPRPEVAGYLMLGGCLPP
jgi:hypothetical protein